MAKSKYQEYYQQMVDSHPDLFQKFQTINDEFARQPEKVEKEFHEVGQKVLDVVREFDRRLCSAMGRGVYSQYSQQLSEKFWTLVRSHFSHIDMVGVHVKKKGNEAV